MENKDNFKTKKDTTDYSKLLCDKPPFLGIIVGKKASGKSQLIRYLCYKYRNLFNYIVVCCPTSGMNNDYNYLPKDYVHTSYTPDLINKIIAKQEAFKMANKNIHCLLILDDIASDPNINFKKTKFTELSKLFSANRHYNISALFVGHTLKTLPKMLRSNCDYAFITRVLASSVDDLYDEFGDRVKNEFKDFLKTHTTDFKMLCYNNRSNAEEPFHCFKIPEEFINSFKFKLQY